VTSAAGVTDQMLPGLNTSAIPNINEGPVGPHPCGSYEVSSDVALGHRVVALVRSRRQ
jgi:hypothetical protein